MHYLYCSSDQALPFAVQQMMVQNVCQRYGVSFAEHHLNASHSPFLSMPERVLEVVQQIAEDNKRRELGSKEPETNTSWQLVGFIFARSGYLAAEA